MLCCWEYNEIGHMPSQCPKLYTNNCKACVNFNLPKSENSENCNDNNITLLMICLLIKRVPFCKDGKKG